MIDYITTENATKAEIGSLVYCLTGDVGIFLGFEDRGGDEDFIKVARVRRGWRARGLLDFQEKSLQPKHDR